MRLRQVWLPGATEPRDVDVPGGQGPDVEGRGLWFVPGLVDPQAAMLPSAVDSGFAGWFAPPGVGVASPGRVVLDLLDAQGRPADLRSGIRAGAAGAGLRSVPDAASLRIALEQVAAYDLPVWVVPVDASLAVGCSVAEGVASQVLGVPGLPVEAEAVAIDVLGWVARRTGVRRLVVGPVVSAIGLAALQRIPGAVGFTTVGHLVFDDEAVARTDHVGGPWPWPPPQSPADRAALACAVGRGEVWLSVGESGAADPATSVRTACAVVGASAAFAALGGAAGLCEVGSRRVLMDPETGRCEGWPGAAGWTAPSGG